MKKYLFALLLILTTGSCSNSILEREQIDKLNVQADEKDGKICLSVSGLCMCSAYVVRGKEVTSYGDTLQIIIKKSLAGKRTDSGHFSYSVEIPSHINHVVFGDNKVVIWDKHAVRCQ